jgi:hypothetical protein
MRDRPEGRLGHSPVARSSRGGGPCAHAIARAMARGHRAQLASGTARWRGRGDHREDAGQQEQRRGSPRVAVDYEVGVAARCGGARRGPCRREGQQ